MMEAITREKLERDAAEYERRGGEVEAIPFGQCACREFGARKSMLAVRQGMKNKYALRHSRKKTLPVA